MTVKYMAKAVEREKRQRQASERGAPKSRAEGLTLAPPVGLLEADPVLLLLRELCKVFEVTGALCHKSTFAKVLPMRELVSGDELVDLLQKGLPGNAYRCRMGDG